MDALALLREHEPEIKKRFGVAKIGILWGIRTGRGATRQRCGRVPPTIEGNLIAWENPKGTKTIVARAE